MRSRDIAIIGMAGRFPGADSVEEFWNNICARTDCITVFSEAELIEAGVRRELLARPEYVRSKGYLNDWDCFDCEFFDYSPAEATIMDPHIRLLHECAWLALEDAGYASGSGLNPVGLFVGGSSHPEWFCAAQQSQKSPADKYLGIALNDHHALSTRISYKFDLTGPSLTLQTACSSSLVAIHYACQSILSGECRSAIAGGVSLIFPPKAGYLHEPGMVTSPDGRCRTFDAAGKGTLAGDGCALIVLRPREDAVACGDHIYAVIRGSAVNNDGRNKIGYTAPGITGQAEVIRAAQRCAGSAPETIGLVEAHGTATPLGDPAEIAALTQAFNTSRRQYCAIGSVKSNIGHLNHAAGVAGLVKAALALHRRILPPTLHFESPNPEIDFEASPFYVNTAARQWLADGSRRRAAVSSFGIGGTNAHAILEEEIEPVRAEDHRVQAIILSAKTASALDRARLRLADHLKDPSTALSDIAYTLQVGRAAFRHRLAVIGSESSAVAACLQSGQGPRYLRGAAPERARPVALLLPGQGAQHAGMGAGLFERFRVYRESVEECLDSLEITLQVELRPIVTGLGARAGDVRQTRLAQPALFICEYAFFRLLASLGIKPVALLGHSLGEFIAACLSGVFSLQDGLRLAAIRGELMQSMPAGCMLELSASPAEVERLLPKRVSIAAINGPSRCVASGPPDEIAKFSETLAARGVDARQLMTSHAFHSESMGPIQDRFEFAVATVARRKPAIPFISNLTGRWIRSEDAMNPSYWARQLREPVQFAAGLSTLFEVQEAVYLEAGPGMALTAMARGNEKCPAIGRVASGFRHRAARDDDAAAFQRGIAQLWCEGAAIDWARMHESGARRVSLPGYSFERRRFPPAPGSTSREGMEVHEAEAEIYQPAWTRAELLAASAKASVVLFAPAAWASGAADSLARAGHAVTTVVPGRVFEQLGECAYAINPTARDQYSRLIAKLASQPERPQFFLHAWSLASRPEFDETQAAGFYSLLYLAQALTESRWTGVDVCAMSLDATAAARSARISPAQATILALCPVITQESVGVACRGINVCSDDLRANGPGAILHRVLAAQVGGVLEHGIALRKGDFWRPEAIPVRLPRVQQFVRRESVVAIIGGFGDVGRALAEHLYARAGARIALIGRPPLTADSSDLRGAERARFVRSLQDRGARVCALAADCTSEGELRSAITRVERELGPINVVIHAAAATRGDSISTPLLRLTREHCEEQFDAKVKGLLVLERALEGKTPEYVLLMSSLASELGGIGLAAYAAANRFMDAVAERSSNDTTAWTAVDWDGWDIPGSPRSGAWRGRSRLLSLDEGLDLCGRILARPAYRRLLVSTTDLAIRRSEWLTPRAAAADPRPDSDADTPEGQLIAIWERFFGRVGLQLGDNFYALGGDSLMAISLVSRINSAFQLQLQVGDFLRTENIGALCSLLSASSADTGGAILMRAETRDDYPTSFEQQSILAARNSIYPTRFNCSAAFEIERLVDPERLERAFRKLVARHEILRTCFDRGVRRQRVLRATPSHLPVISGDAEAVHILDTFVQPFDPTEPPLMRAALVNAPSHPRLLLLDAHHSITDAVSLNVMMRELWSLYNGDEIGPVQLHYGDYAVWQHRNTANGRVERDRRFWHDWLDGFVWTALPSGPGGTAPEHGQMSTTIDAGDRQALARFCERTAATPMTVLLSSLALVVARLTEQLDITLGLRVSRRTSAALETMLGPFVDDAPCRLRIPGRPDTSELLRQVADGIARSLDHGFYPYDRLNDDLQQREPTPNGELFSIMVNYVPAIQDMGASGRFRALPRPASSKYDLNLRLRDGASLVLDAKYRSDKYSASFISDFLTAIADQASETCSAGG